MLRGRVKAPLTASAAIAGVVVGHGIAYVLAVPGAAARETLLARSGHGYWSTAVAVAVVLGVAAVAGTIARHLIHGMRRDTEPSSSWERYRSTALRLAALQATVFVLQEVLERLHAGAPLGGLMHDGFVILGLAVQVLVAAAIAFVLTWLGRAAEAIGASLGITVRPRLERARLVLPATPPPTRASLGGARLTRAPPSLLALDA